MEPWKEILQKSVTTPQELYHQLGCDFNVLQDVIAKFPMRINPYFLNLIDYPGDPIWKQCIPDALEINDTVCIPDPLSEEDLSPIPNLVHKYANRVLLLVSSQCAMYCRFCTRKRKVGTSKMHISDTTLSLAYDYLRLHPEVTDVLISGGDPFLLDDERLDEILGNLSKIPSIKMIRIGTRVPSVLPMRITSRLCSILKKYQPLYINTHFNHPKELTAEAKQACFMLADAGISLGCQTVLLKGVNDNVAVLKELFQGLLYLRVKPYYLFQSDLTQGVNHFRTSTQKGVNLMKGLYGHLSGMAIPTFALDAPGGKGKIPLTPQFIRESTTTSLTFENYLGQICTYPEPIGTDE
ncbi:MAG: lysine 2,3-aminomutase [Desulfotalea sp.]|nr:MAG: lysine 2,3-aminomutase [Desulfotalea sp.]